MIKLPKYIYGLSLFILVILVCILLIESPRGWYYGTKEYFKGQGHYIGHGDNPCFLGIDFKTRIPIESRGCLASKEELAFANSNNAALKFWTSLLGYQKDAYILEIISRELIKKQVSNFKPFEFGKMGGNYIFIFDDKRIEVDSTIFKCYGQNRQDTMFQNMKAMSLNDRSILLHRVYNLKSTKWHNAFQIDLKRNELIEFIDFEEEN